MPSRAHNAFATSDCCEWVCSSAASASNFIYRVWTLAPAKWESRDGSLERAGSVSDKNSIFWHFLRLDSQSFLIEYFCGRQFFISRIVHTHPHTYTFDKFKFVSYRKSPIKAARNLSSIVNVMRSMTRAKNKIVQTKIAWHRQLVGIHFFAFITIYHSHSNSQYTRWRLQFCCCWCMCTLSFALFNHSPD